MLETEGPMLEGPMLETLDYTIRIGSIPTFLYFDFYLYSAYAAHFVYFSYGCPSLITPSRYLIAEQCHNNIAIMRAEMTL